MFTEKYRPTTLDRIIGTRRVFEDRHGRAYIHCPVCRGRAFVHQDKAQDCLVGWCSRNRDHDWPFYISINLRDHKTYAEAMVKGGA